MITIEMVIITVRMEGIIKLKKALRRIPSQMRKAIIKANEETAKEYMKLVYHEFDKLISAQQFLEIVKTHFDNMITSHTGVMKRSLMIRESEDGWQVGWFEDQPHYAKYVVLGTVHIAPRNPILEALKTLELPSRYLWQDPQKSQLGSALPIMSRGFDDPLVAKAYLRGVIYNLDSMIALKTGKLRDSLRIKKVGSQYRVGWFEEAPHYVKFVLMGTRGTATPTTARNPLIHAWDQEKILQMYEHFLAAEMKKALN